MAEPDDTNDSLSTELMDARLADIAPLLVTLKGDVPPGFDPEISEWDTDALPQPLRHFVLALSALETVQAEIVRCGVAIDNGWEPPETVRKMLT